MLTLLILLALAIVLSPFAMIPLLHSAETLAEDEAIEGHAQAICNQETH